MTVAQRKINLAQKVLQTKDVEVLNTIDLIFSQEDEQIELTQAQKRELDKRLAEVDNGTARFYTWAEAKKIIRKKHKKA